MAASPAFTFTGASGSLARLDTTAGATVTATLDNLAGVGQVTWSVVGTDDAGGTYTLATSGPLGSVCTFTAGSAGTAGGLKCTVNAGLDATGAADATLSATAKWSVPTAAGFHVGFAGENAEHNSTYGWLSIVNDVARNAVVGGGSTFADNAFRVTGSSDATKRLAFEVDGLTTATTRTVTIPDKNGTLAMTSDIVGPTFSDSSFRIYDNSDNTRIAAFECSGISTGTTRTFTLPNASATISCISVAERFSGAKSFDDGTCILIGSVTGQVTLKAAASGGSVTATFPDADGTVTCDGVASTFSAAKTFSDGTCVLAGSSSGTTTIKAAAAAGTTTATFQAASGTVAYINTAQSITGAFTFADTKLLLAGSSSGAMTLKAPAVASTYVATFPAATGTVAYTSDFSTLSDATVRVVDDGDATKILAFQCSGITTGNTRTLTVPDASGTITLDGAASTFSAVKTFSDGNLALAGSSSGTLTLKAPAAASTYVATLPAATGTLSMIDFAESITGAKTFGDGKCILAGSSSGTTTLKANATAGTTTATFQAASGTVAYLTDATAQFDNVLFKQNADGAASTTTGATTFFYFGYARTITALYWLARGTSAQDATNYATILVERFNSSNVLQGTVATRSTTPSDGGTITTMVPYSLGAITNASASAGDYLKITISKAGTGVTLASAEVCVVC
jgi:hypothetical protein